MEIKERFLPGKEWLYYNIYISNDFADEVVILFSDFFTNLKIDNWFFIRYNIPEFHLRVRFNSFSYSLIDQINTLLQPYFDNRIIWNVDIGTYCREIERYCDENIIESEQLFHYDSNSIARIMKHYLQHESSVLPSRWIVAIKLTNDYFDLFKYSRQKKIDLLKQIISLLSEEFKIGKNFNNEFNLLFQNYRYYINNLPTNLIEILESRYAKIEKPISVIKKRVDNSNYNVGNLVSSYFHMSNNRLFDCNPRFQELIVYMFILRMEIELKAKKILVSNITKF